MNVSDKDLLRSDREPFKELNLTSAACASSIDAYSANPYRQLSLLLRSRTRRILRRVPSLAPRFASPVVDATLAPFFAGVSSRWLVDEIGLFSFETPLTSSSSDTEGSKPRNKRNCEGWLSGEASLSPVLAAFAGGATAGSACCKIQIVRRSRQAYLVFQPDT